MKSNISAILLCAGESSRMGDFKPLLPLGTETVIGRCVRSLGALCNNIVVVTGKRADEVEKELFSLFPDTGSGALRCVRNERYAFTDMLCSIRLGLSALPFCDRFFLMPADMPLIGQETFLALLEQGGDADAVFPSYRGRRGHPVLIRSSLIPAILSYRGEDGLRGFFGTITNQKTVEVGDEGILLDLDTQGDYHKALAYIEKLT